MQEQEDALHTPPQEPEVPQVDTPQFEINEVPVVRPAPMRVKARQFNGDTSWQEYHSHFERVCNLNGWHQHRLDYLWVNLTSTALAYAESLPYGTVRTYEQLRDALEQRFGDSQRAEVYKSELRSRQRKEGESLPALGQAVRQLVTHAYPGIGPRGSEELCIEKFREAITDSEQRMAVHRSHAHTLEEAIKAAMDMESWQISERRNKPHRVRAAGTETEAFGELTQRIASLEKLLEASSKAENNNVDGNRKPVTCFYCKKPGHIKRDCFKRARDLAQATETKNEGNDPQLH